MAMRFVIFFVLTWPNWLDFGAVNYTTVRSYAKKLKSFFGTESLWIYLDLKIEGGGGIPKF